MLGQRRRRWANIIGSMSRACRGEGEGVVQSSTTDLSSLDVPLMTSSSTGADPYIQFHVKIQRLCFDFGVFGVILVYWILKCMR